MMTVATVPSASANPMPPEAQFRAPEWALRREVGDDRFLPVGRPIPSIRRAKVEAKPKSKRAMRNELVETDDLALLRKVLERNELAFSVFVERFRNLMVACVARVCMRAGVRLQDDDLADVLADISVNMVAHDYRRLRLYRTDGGCSVSSWVGVIATSTAHDYLRRERRRRTDPVIDSELERIAPPVDGPDLFLIDREQRKFVDEALRGFSKRDRMFVEMYFVQAMSPDAIAEKMGVSVSTVYSKKAKIKSRLKKLAKAAA